MMLLVSEAAMRPASAENACFYCRQPIGNPHSQDCVLIKRKVKVSAVIDYEIEVPAHWGKEEIEFHRNEGSWCASNLIDEIVALSDIDGCLCSSTEFKFVAVAGEPYLKES
jgi:hypothetical protein